MNGPRQSDRTRDAATFFTGSRLTLARHLAGLRKNALAERIGKTPTAVTAFESGTKRPSPRTVALLALALGVEPTFFMVNSTDLRAESGPPHFRSLRSTTQLARDQAHAYGLLAIDVATALERHVEFPPRDVPTALVDPEDLDESGPEDAARRVRAQWGLPAGPVGHLVRIAEHHGVLVVFSPVQTASVDAYSIDTPARPVVLLNPLKHDYFRQRFDLAHELGHLVMHGDAEPGGRLVEEQANRFAAELLMPATELRHLLPRRADWLTLGRLKEQWNVSLQALLFRARRLGVMNEVTYRNAMTAVSAKGWRRREPGPMPPVE
ncbi:MAG: XRE family transcriptional regulator, partial [Pseudonocardiaceae bacterium]